MKTAIMVGQSGAGFASSRARNVARQLRHSLSSRLVKVCALASAAFAAISFGPKEAHALFWQEWEDWEGSTAPLYQGVNGNSTAVTGSTAFSPTHFSLLGTAGTPPGWWSIGRYFTPPSGHACTAFAAYRGAGVFTTVQVKLDVIDQSSTFLHKGSVVNVSRDQAWTWRSGTFTSNGNQIFVRLMLYSSSGGSNVYADDIVVECN